MTKLNSLESTIKAMLDAVQKMNEGSLDKEGFDTLVDNAKDVYEKMVILRYKSYEELIFGKKVESEEVPVEETTEAKIDLSSIPYKTDTGVTPSSEEKEPEAKPESPSFDFSLFDDKEESDDEVVGEGEVEEANEESKEEVIEIKAEEIESENVESVQEELPRSQEHRSHQDIFEQTFGSDEPEEEEEEAEEEKMVAEITEIKPLEDVKTESTSFFENNPAIDAAVEAPKLEPTTPMEESSVGTQNSGDDTFIQKFSKIDNDEIQRLSISRLSTLIGAFGLNERLQCINELFDGSSEAFSEAIKAIDSRTSLNEAIAIAADYAKKYEWDLNSETVDEFVFKIKRRYV